MSQNICLLQTTNVIVKNGYQWQNTGWGNPVMGQLPIQGEKHLLEVALSWRNQCLPLAGWDILNEHCTDCSASHINTEYYSHLFLTNLFSQEVQERIKTHVLATDLSYFKYDDFIYVLDLVNRYLKEFLSHAFCFVFNCYFIVHLFGSNCVTDEHPSQGGEVIVLYA